MRFVFLFLLLATPALAGPLFPNSVVSNDLDFIRPEDPTLFACLAYRGANRREMPNPDRDGLFLDNVHVFAAQYADGTQVDLWVDPGLGDQHAAARTATPVAEAIGRLPGPMRDRLVHVTINQGTHTAFAEEQAQFFTMSSDNIQKRLSTRDLDETVFHESVHATLDVPHASARTWTRAQRKDGDFITEYAARLPGREDLAETALFAFALTQHPGRLPANIEEAVRDTVPNRLIYLEQVLAQMGPYPAPATERPTCG